MTNTRKVPKEMVFSLYTSTMLKEYFSMRMSLPAHFPFAVIYKRSF